MNTSETSASPQPAAAKSHRFRSFVVGSALVLSGVIVGVGTSALSQGYGPHRGWSDDGGGGRFERFGGPGGFFRDHDGPRGWFDRDRDGWRGGPRFGGGMFFTPGRIERMVNRLAWAVDASSEQKQKLTAIIQRAADDLRPLREKRVEARRQLRDVLTAPTIDRSKLEAMRADHMKLADQASQRITAALAEAAEVLTPEQRADLARRLERFGPRGG
jgi:Spy/CpxP family protein refolding chaperone